ncbi:MAG: ABC transporter substrate-binding protein [Lentisphaeria bacterium]|nr:ABC transporter substrate-binding protein [Lentisphaeria bacterium]
MMKFFAGIGWKKKAAAFFFVLLAGSVCAGEAVRIVSLSPSLTELVCHLGGKNCLVGRSSACDHPAEIRSLPTAGDFARPDTEKLLSLRPDAVITCDLIVPAAANALARCGIKVLFLPCRSVSEYREACAAVGKLIGREGQARAEMERIDSFVASCAKWKKLDRRILCLIWFKPPIAAGENTFLAELVALTGARCCDLKGTKGYFKPSAEFLLGCGADTLLVFSDPVLCREHPVLRHTEAVKKGRVVHFSRSELLQRPGPRFTEGVLQLRKALEK